MGVLNCSRRCCDNIMCNTYVRSVGYVCDDCQEEFKEYLLQENISLHNDYSINKELEKFMDTDKGSFSKKNKTEMDVNEFFRMNTRNSDCL